VNRISKEEIVRNYSVLFNSYQSIFLVRNLGLSVLDIKSIRSQFKSVNSKFMVVKNSLAKIALKNTQFSTTQEYFCGPIALIYSNDPISASKILIKICNDYSKAEVMNGMTSESCLTRDEVIALSKMLTQDEIRAKIMGLITAVAGKLARVVQEPNAKLVRVMQSYVKQQ